MLLLKHLRWHMFCSCPKASPLLIVIQDISSLYYLRATLPKEVRAKELRTDNLIKHYF